MAAPTATFSVVNWDGIRGATRFKYEFTAGSPDNLADAAIVDISTLAPAPASVKVRSIDLIINGNVNAVFEFDATTDQIIDEFNNQTDVGFQFLRDYTDMPNAGALPSDTGAAGFTGDIVLTTEDAAALDEVSGLVVFERSS